MKNILRIIKYKYESLKSKILLDSRLMDYSNYKSLEPEKFRKTLEYAAIIYRENIIARSYIQRESTAYWQVIDYIQYSKPEDSAIKTALNTGNLKPTQTWKESFDKGDMHWQSVVWSLKDPEFAKILDKEELEKN